MTKKNKTTRSLCLLCLESEGRRARARRRKKRRDYGDEVSDRQRGMLVAVIANKLAERQGVRQERKRRAR